MFRKNGGRLLLSYDARNPAKAAPVSAYYDEDILELEEMVWKAASGSPIEVELTSLLASSYNLAYEQGEAITALRGRLRASEERIQELEDKLREPRSKKRGLFRIFRT